jgi:hypothetical protein
VPRYGVALKARNPKRSDSKIHQVAVEEAFGRLPAGSILPKEAYARTSCGMFATGFVICSFEEVTADAAWKRACRKCP